MAEVARGLPENLIYQFPTVSSLASCVSKSVLGSVNTQAYVEADRIQEMLDKVDKYSSFRVQRTCPLIPNAVVKGDIVLLTGSTGGFGCNILAQLVISETVAKIYALNRPSFQGTPLSNRQADALQDHGFNPDALLNPKVVLVECDLTLPMLGISTSLLEEVVRILSLASIVSPVSSL
jgi:Male sterility protein